LSDRPLQIVSLEGVIECNKTQNRCLKNAQDSLLLHEESLIYASTSRDFVNLQPCFRHKLEDFLFLSATEIEAKQQEIDFQALQREQLVLMALLRLIWC
jgi:hypothetical protein